MTQYCASRRKLRFWNHVIGGDNAHSYACLRLFPTGTQYPAGTPFLRSQWHKVCCTEGIEYRAFCNDIKCVARNSITSVRQSNHRCDANKTTPIAYKVPCHCERSVAISRKGNLVKMAEIRGGKVWFLSVFATKFGVFYNCRKLFWFRLRFLTLGRHNILWSEKFWKIFGIFRRKK